MPPESMDENTCDAWFRDNGISLTTLDPDAPLDDLEPLRAIVGTARVVAIGENAHFINEFTRARQRVLRFLNERCGFDVFAFEYGFGAGFALEPWISGSGSDDDLTRIAGAAVDWGAGDMLRWLRRHNRTARDPIRFVGIDLPDAGGAVRPALEPVVEYLSDVDPDSARAVVDILETTDVFTAGSGAAAAPAWAKLAPATQDAVTAGLARLRLRFRALEPHYVSRGGQHRFDVALRQVEGACHTDYMWRAGSDLYAGTGAFGDLSVREIYLAESIRWHLNHDPGETRIVVAAHNNHIQKTPVAFDHGVTVLPMGHHLHRALGDDYVNLALTHTADHTPEMYPDESSPMGFTVKDTQLGPPAVGSVEAAFVAADLGLGLIDLRQAPAAARVSLDRIRTQSSYLRTVVPDAFDGVLNVPAATVESNIAF